MELQDMFHVLLHLLQSLPQPQVLLLLKILLLLLDGLLMLLALPDTFYLPLLEFVYNVVQVQMLLLVHQLLL